MKIWLWDSLGNRITNEVCEAKFALTWSSFSEL